LVNFYLDCFDCLIPLWPALTNSTYRFFCLGSREVNYDPLDRSPTSKVDLRQLFLVKFGQTCVACVICVTSVTSVTYLILPLTRSSLQHQKRTMWRMWSLDMVMAVKSCVTTTHIPMANKLCLPWQCGAVVDPKLHGEMHTEACLLEY